MTPSTFNPWPLIIFVGLALLAISLLSHWYAQEVTLPRYCENPEQTLQLLQKILTEERPAGEETRRPYIIAAKLLFLVPRQSDEAIEDYLDRVRYHLREQCR
jgi:hypothetical protein